MTRFETCLLTLLLVAGALPARDAQNCVVCHSVPLLMRAESEDSLRVFEVDMHAYSMTSHGRIACTDCHEDITGYPHPEQVAKVDCGKTCHINKPYTQTGFSHRDQVRLLASSVHGVKPGEDPALSRRKPTCTYCHGNRIYEKDPALLIKRANRCRVCHMEEGLQEMLVHIDRLGELHNAETSMDIVRVCSSCHAQEALMKQMEINPTQVEGFQEHFHGKAMSLGLNQAAHCADCHGSHTVLPAEDPESTVSGERIASTCGACHPGATLSFARAAVHSEPSPSDSPLVYYVEVGFYVLTGATMAFLFGHILLDFLRWCAERLALVRKRRRLRREAAAKAEDRAVAAGEDSHAEEDDGTAGSAEVAEEGCVPEVADASGADPDVPAPHRTYLRFSVAQRLQHLFMFVPFIVLVLTGFPLKFPHSEFWGFVLQKAGGLSNLRLVHRVAATVLIIDFLVHILLLVQWAWRKRPGLRDLILVPNLQDGKDLLQNLRYYGFLTPERPRFDRFSYIEKFDYWAVFWGMFIMAGSGLVLWHPVAFSHVLSGDLIRIAAIAHSDEALLAFLAISCWHFYNVHFNPRVWPANKVWWKGTMTEEEMEHEHPLELERIKAAEAPQERRQGDRRERVDRRGKDEEGTEA